MAAQVILVHLVHVRVVVSQHKRRFGTNSFETPFWVFWTILHIDCAATWQKNRVNAFWPVALFPFLRRVFPQCSRCRPGRYHLLHHRSRWPWWHLHRQCHPPEAVAFEKFYTRSDFLILFCFFVSLLKWNYICIVNGLGCWQIHIDESVFVFVPQWKCGSFQTNGRSNTLIPCLDYGFVLVSCEHIYPISIRVWGIFRLYW